VGPEEGGELVVLTRCCGVVQEFGSTTPLEVSIDIDCIALVWTISSS